MIKQEMPRVNINIFGISELKWAGIPQKKWSSHDSQQESEMQYMDAVSKMTE